MRQPDPPSTEDRIIATLDEKDARIRELEARMAKLEAALKAADKAIGYAVLPRPVEEYRKAREACDE